MISEAAYVSLEVYMEEVEDFYQELELHQPVAQRKIFLATDDPGIIPEMKKKSVIKHGDRENIETYQNRAGM